MAYFLNSDRIFNKTRHNKTMSFDKESGLNNVNLKDQ